MYKRIFEKNIFNCYNTFMQLSSEVKFVLNRLNEAGYEAYLVGGSVRDFLLNKHNKDIDITTNAIPEEVKRIFVDFPVIDTGIKHGTVTILYNNLPIEITTYRIDGEYQDSRHPKEVKFTSSLKEDLSRRDFTINAMAYNNELIDYYGGRDDLKNKMLRAVGNPNKRFEEDALRILRGLRFASNLGFSIEEKTILAMRENKLLLKNISSERIQNELNAILLGDYVKDVMLDYYDIFEVILPEITPCVCFDQHNSHHIYDVYAHIIVAVSSAVKDKVVRLTLLFHDLGKPESFSLDENKNGHFYRHAEKSEIIARNILNRLKYDNESKRQILTLIRYHDAILQDDVKQVKRWLNRLGEDMFRKLIEVQIGDNFAQHPKHRDRQVTLNNIKKLIDQIIAENNCFNLRQLAVNGYDMIELGYEKFQIKSALQYLLNAVINNEVENERDKLINYLNYFDKKNE